MPNSTHAALVFLLIILPGFLVQGGYRVGRAVPEHAHGLAAVARVIALSVLIVLAAWKLGGEAVYDHARAGTALTTHEGGTYRFAVGLFVIPPVIGYVCGQIVDAVARRLAEASERLPEAPSNGDEPLKQRLRRRILEAPVSRLINEGPTTWDRTWRRLRRTQPLAVARVTTKGGREIVGVVARDSRVALSPQPRDLYLEEVLRQAEDGNYYPTAFGLGAFLSGTEIESVEWVSEQGLFYD